MCNVTVEAHFPHYYIIISKITCLIHLEYKLYIALQ